MRLFDTHCHLNDAEAFPEPEQALVQARKAGVERVVAVGIDTDSSRCAIDLADRFELVYATVGWHPNCSANYRPDELITIRQMAEHPRVVAIGEIGLDFHHSYATYEQQLVALNDHLALAEELAKPVVFHCRNAYDRLLMLMEERKPRVRSVLHCFGGTQHDAERAASLGCWFGVDGPITYKSADELRSVVANLPRKRVIIETDSPYLSPVPHRGKPNQPAYVSLINERLAELWGVTADEAAEITWQNACEFFGLP